MLTLSSCLLLLAPLVAQGNAVVSGSDGRKLDQYLTRCETLGFSGVVLVERKGAVVLEKGYGIADPIEGTPNTPDTLYDIASASKQVTAAAVLLLEARGKLKTSDKLADYLPDVPSDVRDITLAHLLHHTAGFPRSGPSGHGDDRDAAVAKYLSGKRSARAGKRFEYWNGGYALLAAVVEVVAEQPFEDFVRAELLRPAGMERSDFIETATPDVGPLAHGLVDDGTSRYGDPTTKYLRGWAYRGMGGVLTSARELRIWCNALFGGRVLPREQLEWMLTPDVESYAGGWYVRETEEGRKVVQHQGSAGPFETYIRWFPKEETLILVFCNRKGWNWQTTWGLTALLLDGEDPKAPQPPQFAAWSASEFERWLGAWVTDDGQRLELERSGAGVHLGGVGDDVMAALKQSASGRGAAAASARRAKAGAKDRANAETRALAIVDGLREGNIEAFGTELAPNIPRTWPGHVRDDYWPAHVERWGPVKERRVLGVVSGTDATIVRVWIRVVHERGERALSITFNDDELAGLDLKAAAWPVEAGAAPVDDERLEGFDFTQAPPFTLELEGKGRKSRLVLHSRSGPKLEFQRAP